MKIKTNLLCLRRFFTWVLIPAMGYTTIAVMVLLQDDARKEEIGQSADRLKIAGATDAEPIPRMVITAARMTAEQKANFDLEEQAQKLAAAPAR